MITSWENVHPTFLEGDMVSQVPYFIQDKIHDQRDLLLVYILGRRVGGRGGGVGKDKFNNIWTICDIVFLNSNLRIGGEPNSSSDMAKEENMAGCFKVIIAEHTTLIIHF